MTTKQTDLNIPTENNIHVHDLLTFQQITVVSKAKGATLFACDLQVSNRPLFCVTQHVVREDR